MLGAVGESQGQVVHPLASQALTGQPVMRVVKLDLGFNSCCQVQAEGDSRGLGGGAEGFVGFRKAETDAVAGRPRGRGRLSKVKALRQEGTQ